MKKKRIFKNILIGFVSLFILLSMFTINSVLAYETISDPDTSDNYTSKLITEETGSKNAGQLWTDKSVNTKSVLLNEDTDGIDSEVSTDTDFLHTYSLMSSSQIINEEVPLDVMFVIDISNSMSASSTDSSTPAIIRCCDTLNRSIKQLLTANPDARWGLAVFSSKAAVVIELGANKLNPNIQFSSAVLGATTYNMTFNYINEEGEAKTVRVSNNTNQSNQIRDDSWNTVLRNVNGFDFIVDGGETNVQSGLKAGLEELAKAEDTVITSALGNQISRIPAMILLTDGSANTFCDLEPIETTTPIPEDHNFVDVNGAVGSANVNFTDFDITKDFGHSNNYIELYGFNKELNQYIDNTTIATVTTLIDDNEWTMPGLNQAFNEEGEDFTSIILSTLLTASYYTSAVNNHYQTNAINQKATNLTNIELQTYTIYASTQTVLDGSEDHMEIVNKVLNPTEYFTAVEKENDAYDLFTKWKETGSASKTIYPYYPIADAYMEALTGFWNTPSEEFTAFIMADYNYDPERDGDYNQYYQKIFAEYLKLYAQNHLNTLVSVRTRIELNLTDDWLIEHNPYNVSAEEVKNNINYVLPKNALKINSSQVQSTFENIINELTGKAFISVSGTNSMGIDNSVTYMDAIGEYMTVNGTVKIDGTSSDMSLLLNSNSYPIDKSSVYDYQFNNTYVSRMRTENRNPNYSFVEGWYLGDDPQTAHYSANGSWEEGYVYRIRYDSAINYVPTLKSLTDINNDGEINAEDLSEKQKNTVYSIYTYNEKDATNSHLSRLWRVNPSYLSSIENLNIEDIDPDTFIIKGSDKQEYYTSLNENGYLPDGIYRLFDIRIWLEDTGDYKDVNPEGELFAGLGYDQALYVNIPASAVPTQIAEISYSEKSGNISLETNLDKKDESTPLRLFYGVGMQEEYKLDNDSIDLTKIAKTYLDNHTDENGKVYFYSNYYSNNKYDDYLTDDTARTRGDPVVTFSPEIENKYYIYQHFHILYTTVRQVIGGTLVELDDTPLNFEEKLTHAPFENESAALEAINNGELNEGDYVLLDSDTTNHFDSNHDYYLILNYYVDSSSDSNLAEEAMVVTKRKGSVFKLDRFQNIKESEIVCWYDPDNTEAPYVPYSGPDGPEGYMFAVRPGGVRLGDMAQSIETKGERTGGTYTSGNLTQTANNLVLPTLGTNSGAGNDLLLNMYLGNNGLLTVDNSKIFVTKLVSNKEGEFAKTNEPLSYKEFDYQIYLSGYEGIRNAIKVQWDDVLRLWRRRIATIDVITDNNNLLQNTDLTLAKVNELGVPYQIGVDQGSAYYVYIKDLDTNNDDSDFENKTNTIRVYSAPDYKGAEIQSGERVRGDDNCVQFNASEVYLIPTEQVDFNSQGWTFNEGVYKQLNNFTIAKMVPENTDDRTNGLDLSSPYAIRSEYLTVSLNFGLNNGLDNGDVDFPAPKTLFENSIFSVNNGERTKFVKPDSINSSTAQFTLKHGEGLLFNSLPSDAAYRITERLNSEKDPGWILWNKNENITSDNANAELKIAVKHLGQDSFIAYDNNLDVSGAYNLRENRPFSESELAQIPDNFSPNVVTEDDGSKTIYYSLSGQTDNYEEGVQYINTAELSNLTVEKELIADTDNDINEVDENTIFDFDLSLSYPENFTPTLNDQVRYKYAIFNKTANESELAQEGYLVSLESQLDNSNNILVKDTDNQKQTWEIKLKSTQILKVYDLLIGTEYSLTEKPSYGFVEVNNEGETLEGFTHTGIINQEDDENSNEIIVTNLKENPQETTLNLIGNKSIISATKDANIPELSDGQFTFVIEPDESNDKETDPIKEKTEVKNTEDGSIPFFGEDQKFTKAGTYIYKITEKEFNDSTITRDPSVYKLVVNVKEDYGNDSEHPQFTGNLKASTALYKGEDSEIALSNSDITFNNSYKPEPVTINFEGNKSYIYDEGGNNQPIHLQGGEFSFVLSTRNEYPQPENLIVTNEADGSFKFGDITFTEPGTYNYRIFEKVNNTNDSITYDPTIYYIRVEVKDIDGKLVPTYKSRQNDNEDFKDNYNLEFTNIRNTGSLSITKHIQGVQPRSNEQFEFKIDLLDTTTNNTYSDVEFKNGVALITLTAGETKKITGLPIGTQYIVTETNSLGYSTSYEGDNSGIIQKDVESEVIVNNKKNEPVSVEIEGNKTITHNPGNDYELKENDFSFILIPNESNSQADPLYQSNMKVSNKADGTFDFSLEFTQTGIYSYTLMEVVDNNDSRFIYDSNSYIVKVKVTEGEDNKLVAEKEITQVGGSAVEEPINFTNTYSPEDISVILGGKKVYENGRLIGNDFEFEITPISNNPPMPENTVISNDVAGYFSFDPITFNEVGEYKYLIKENDTGRANVTYSTVTYDVTIIVTDNNGKLEATTTVEKVDQDQRTGVDSDKIEFINTLEVADLSVHKIVNGSDLDRSLDFEFTLTLYQDETFSSESIRTNINGTYGDLTFNEGVAKFTLKHNQTVTAKNLPSGIYYKVIETESDEYTVEDGAEKTGQITKELGPVTFTNTRTSISPTEYNLKVLKVVDGNSEAKDTFKFMAQLTSNNKSGVNKETFFTKIEGPGEVSFENIEFTEAGTYTFEVSEIFIPQIYHVNKKVHTVDIEVKLNEVTRSLYINNVIFRDDVSEIIFVNSYMEPTTALIEGTKNLISSNVAEDKELTDGEFKFRLTPDENNPVDDPLNKTFIETSNDSNGNFSFGLLNYSSPNTYNYTLEEVIPDNGEKAGYEFDKTSYHVKVRVYNNHSDSNLSVEKTITKNEDNSEVITPSFTNKYNPNQTDVRISGTKTFEQGKLNGSDFTFLIKPISNNAPIPEELTTQNNSEGIFEFGPITFTEEGDYVYEVSEINRTRANVMYSQLVYEVRIHVADIDGNLVATPKYYISDNEVNEINFRNIQRIGNLSISKEVQGSNSDKNNSYEFKVSLFEDEELTNSAEYVNGTYGDITFEDGVAEIFLKDNETATAMNLPAGIYFKIEESEYEGFKVEYDQNTGLIDENQTVYAHFTNIKDAILETEYALPINKEVKNSGDQNPEDLFTFSLADANNNIDGYQLPENNIVQLKAGETSKFEPIKFTKEGSYSFVVSEINIPGYYRPDKRQHSVTVNIAMNNSLRSLYVDSVLIDNVITITNTDSYEGLTFTNYLLDATTVTLEGTKYLVDKEGKHLAFNGEEFSFILVPSENNSENDPINETNNIVTNDENGYFRIDIPFTSVGHYIYTLRELSSDKSEYIYDNSTYQIEVTVYTEDNSNSLKLMTKITKNGVEVNPDNIEFTNVIDLTNASVNLEGKKVLENGILSGNDFEFILESVDVTNPMPKQSLVRNDINGYFNFGPITFDTPGTYRYQVREINSNTNNVIYSNVVYNVIINVERSNQQLVANKTYLTNNGEEVDNIEFINYMVGDLEISKTVTGNDADQTTNFNFRVELDNASINGTYGQMDFSNGIANFTLKHGETKTASQLPFGTQYTVIEEDNNDGYTVSKTGDTGTISNQVSRASFENHRDSYGSLEILKVVNGTNADKERDFSFVITLYRDSANTVLATDVSGNYNGCNFNQGVGQFELRDGQTILINNLPANLYYSIVEKNNAGFNVRTRNETGIITKNEQIKVEFFNIREETNSVSYPLEVTKQVVGNPTENSIFNFKLDLIDGDIAGVTLPQNQIISIQGAGVTRFDDITFTKAGTYKFTVSEINIPENYEVDNSTHEITIIVEEIDNQLQISKVVIDNGSPNISFVNTFEENAETSPMVGISKSHAKENQDYHTNQNEVQQSSSVWYELTILNKGSATAHNLVISDVLPETIKLTGDVYITRSEGLTKGQRISLDVSGDFNADLGYLEISNINNEPINLSPGEELDLEYEVNIPDEVSNESYWTNHAWITYDEINQEVSEAQSQGINGKEFEANILDLSSSNLMNFDLIDIPIETEVPQSNSDLSTYHSLLYSELESTNPNTVHVKYSNDVIEHYNISTSGHNANNNVIEEPDDNKTRKTPDPDNVLSSDDMNQRNQNSDNSDSDNSNNQVDYQNNDDSTNKSQVTDYDDLVRSSNTSSTTNSDTSTSTTGVTTTAPQTGLGGLTILPIWLIIIGVLGLITVFLFRKSGKKD